MSTSLLRRLALALLRLWLPALGCVPLLLAAPAALSQAPRDTVTVNFAGADLESVIRAMGEITGRNFLVDPRVKGTINVVTPGPVTVAQAYEIFLASLRVLGFTAVEAQGITTILPEADARQRPLPVTLPGDARPPGGERLVTQVFMLKHESASQLLPILRPLIAPNNTIAAHPGNNSLVITDYAGNMNRIARIIEALDNPSAGETVVIAVKHASAVDIAQTATRLLGGDAPAAATDPAVRVTIVADPRTNSVILRGESTARIERARALIESLDRPTSVAGNMHVVYLKNAEAGKVVETLRAILAGAATASVAAGAGQTTGTAVPPSIIQADAATNSLIITASEVVYNSLRGVIEKLDVRRAQVFVEALIVEVSADKAAEFGIQWTGINNINASDTQPRVFGTSNFGGAGQNILGIAANPTTVGRGLSIGIVKGQVNIGGIGTITNLGLLARALESHAKANILSTPNILTMDNEEARIVIGQNVPFITGQYAQSGAAAATTPVPFQTIERRDVGLTLRVRPQISEGGAIKLRIFQEVSSVQDSTNTAGIITNKRSIESTIVVDDGLIVAIGGLIEDRLTNNNEQIPLLGDLPVIGGLFRYDSRRQVKTNLMVFLRPVILRDARSYENVTFDRYDYLLREQQRGAPESRFELPNMTPQLLPDLNLRIDPAQPRALPLAPQSPPAQPPSPSPSGR